MDYIDHSLILKSCQDDGIFEGYASVFDVIDHHQEAVSKGAFVTSLTNWQSKRQLPKMLWQHDPKIPVGTWEEIREDDHGLFVRGRLLLDIRQGREAYALLKAGIVDGLSIGFHLIQSDRLPRGRVLKEVDLREISLVTFAANPKAKITAYKQMQAPPDLMGHFLGRLYSLGEVICNQ
ncbi:MAG: HK97 family phage prohead protease [Alphaproteobacteria bacterium]|nr:HK97 family phage prohead protease [Alphaproteobacteria bacterium]